MTKHGCNMSNGGAWDLIPSIAILGFWAVVAFFGTGWASVGQSTL
ncbi:hypothetical protein [Paenibacillus paeoniae]|nr:hypothetical protein [Paenibacillus paeoniae]